MALKQYSAATPSQRHLISIDRSELWKGKPEKSLSKGLSR
ncbi:MAG: 50S ribosomal protein L2, partial [Rickettsiales bacterium]